LSSEEREAVRAVLHEPRFVDRSPGEVAATLLDEGRYLCSERTMYRILDALGANRERRNQLRHPSYAKPELVATAPNQVWSWDIERHEALLNRAVVKGHGRRSVAADR
jgi:putative transposase